VKNSYEPVFNETHTFSIPPQTEMLELEVAA
jgi:hypothetical protein